MRVPENAGYYDEHKPANVTTKSDGQLTFRLFSRKIARTAKPLIAHRTRIAQTPKPRKMTIVSKTYLPLLQTPQLAQTLRFGKHLFLLRPTILQVPGQRPIRLPSEIATRNCSRSRRQPAQTFNSYWCV